MQELEERKAAQERRLESLEERLRERIHVARCASCPRSSVFEDTQSAASTGIGKVPETELEVDEDEAPELSAAGEGKSGVSFVMSAHDVERMAGSSLGAGMSDEEMVRLLLKLGLRVSEPSSRDAKASFVHCILQ